MENHVYTELHTTKRMVLYPTLWPSMGVWDSLFSLSLSLSPWHTQCPFHTHTQAVMISKYFLLYILTVCFSMRDTLEVSLPLSLALPLDRATPMYIICVCGVCEGVCLSVCLFVCVRACVCKCVSCKAMSLCFSVGDEMQMLFLNHQSYLP